MKALSLRSLRCQEQTGGRLREEEEEGEEGENAAPIGTGEYFFIKVLLSCFFLTQSFANKIIRKNLSVYKVMPSSCRTNNGSISILYPTLNHSILQGHFWPSN